MKRIVYDNPFKNQFKSLLKKHPDIKTFELVLQKLANSEPLPGKFKDHFLKGNWKDYRECHIKPDWLLIYRVTETEVIPRICSSNQLRLFAIIRRQKFVDFIPERVKFATILL